MSNSIAARLSQAANRIKFDGATQVRVDNEAFGPGGLVAFLAGLADEARQLEEAMGELLEPSVVPAGPVEDDQAEPRS